MMDMALIGLAVVIAIVVARLLAWRMVGLIIGAPAGARAFFDRPRVRERMLSAAGMVRTRAPRLYAAVQPRLSPAKFSGLPLTLLTIAALYVAILFSGLIDEVMEAAGVQRIDQAINVFFGPWRQQPLVAIFLWITALGAGPTLAAVSCVSTGFLCAHGKFHFVLPLWTTFLGAQATTWLGKYVIARHRPDFIEAASAVSPAFPSAHATAAMALYGFLAYVIIRDLPSRRARFEIAFWAGVLIAAIGFSRIFLSLHYTSDVIAGYLVGVFWLLVGFALSELGRARHIEKL